MNVNSFSNPVIRSRGITLVEILLVISVLVVLLSFAMPSAGSASARAELKAAFENVQYSIGAARNVARMTETSVSLDILSSGSSSGLAPATGAVQTLSFSRPAQSGEAATAGPDLQDYRLPEGVRLVADRDAYVFDERGLVSEPGRILLVSSADEELTFTIEIE
jgi:Tfp pilus assembly protein FimT